MNIGIISKWNKQHSLVIKYINTGVINKVKDLKKED